MARIIRDGPGAVRQWLTSSGEFIYSVGLVGVARLMIRDGISKDKLALFVMGTYYLLDPRTNQNLNSRKIATYAAMATVGFYAYDAYMATTEISESGIALTTIT